MSNEEPLVFPENVGSRLRQILAAARPSTLATVLENQFALSQLLIEESLQLLEEELAIAAFDGPEHPEAIEDLHETLELADERCGRSLMTNWSVAYLTAAMSELRGLVELALGELQGVSGQEA